MTPSEQSNIEGGPTTFAELLNGAGPKTVSCGRCGKPATLRIQLTVRPIRASGAGVAVAVASHKGALCEACAVAVYDKFRGVIR